MEMPGRKYNPQGYRYGFNGKENDRSGEWGLGLVQDYGFRLYNPGLGRFLSVDPLTESYPELTTYQFASNTPIQAIDLDGLEKSGATKGEGVSVMQYQGLGSGLVGGDGISDSWEQWMNSYGDSSEKSIKADKPNVKNLPMVVVTAKRVASQIQTSSNSIVEKGIDLSDKVPFVSQFSLTKPNVACARASKKILNDFFGTNNAGSSANRIITGRNNINNTDIEPTKNAKSGVDYINQQLEAGNPIMVGVNHDTKKGQADGQPADHYVVITGRGYDEEKQQSYFLFYEVGTRHTNLAKSPENRLYVKPDNTIRGSSSKSTRKFTVTDVRINE
jgi:RHS repeat-associated protein